MEQRHIGALTVSVVGLGCNNFGTRLDAAATAEVVHAALDAGIVLFDTADVYGEGDSERFLGRALRDRRDAAVIATKFGAPMPDGAGASPAWVARACEASLERLGVDHLDLYQLHTPDPDVPVEETLGALGELVAAGKVLEIGCSNFSATQLTAAMDAAAGGRLPAFRSIQNEYSLLHRQPEVDGVRDVAATHDVGFLPYFPLASGLLTGKYPPGQDPPPGARLSDLDPQRHQRWFGSGQRETAAGLARFAADSGRTPVELAFSWLASQDQVASVIAGATSAEQVRQNAAAAGWKLSGAQLAAIDALSPARPAAG